MRTKGPPSSSGVLGGGANLSTALGPPALGRPVAWRQRNEAVSKTKKIVNMLADDTAAPAAARTLAKAAEQEGKLISDYLTERLQHDHAPPTSAPGTKSRLLPPKLGKGDKRRTRSLCRQNRGPATRSQGRSLRWFWRTRSGSSSLTA